MTLYEVFILAFAMAIDCTIVSFSYSLIITKNRFANSLLFAVTFALFQGLMPIIGYFLSGIVYGKLEEYSKWIVFIIFVFLGYRFLKDALSKEERAKISCITVGCLFGLAIATSLDALGSGVSLRFSNTNIWFSAAMINIVTFVMTFIGFWLAELFKKLPSKLMEIVGVLLFVYLAIKAII